MKTQRLNVLQKHNQHLQLRALRNYWVLLKRVCQVHHNQPWAQQARKFLEFEFTKASVESLVDLADSLSKQTYLDAETHFSANQFSLLVRKYPFPSSVNPFTPEVEGYKTFMKSEHKCSRINDRFAARLTRKGKAAPYESELHLMRSFIAYAIGFEPDLRSIFDNCNFGPGAAIGVHGNATHVGKKVLSSWSVSPGAYQYGYAAVCSNHILREHMFKEPLGFTSSDLAYDTINGPYAKVTNIVAYNNIAFVPKTAKTHRSIAVEPLLNGFVQKGTDAVLRLYLKRCGIDLSLQSPNAEMARLGSLSGVEDPLVTIDLRSASDSISIGLAREVLPPQWFEFLKSIRSHSYKYQETITRFQKFCSMGNGFCFPLETLIFVAACKAVGCGRPGIDFRVYGDDIIVSQSKAKALISLLSYLGFATNTDKTFLEGPFRESCGSDWFDGVDVRPYTLDFELDSVQSIYKVLNGSLRNELTTRFFSEIRPFLIGIIPSDFRFFRPYPGPEDTGIDSLCDEFLMSPHVTYRFKNGTGSWRWKELIPISLPDRKIWRHDGARSYALMYAALVGSASDLPFAIRRKTRTKVRYISHPGATSQWLPPA